MQRVNNLQRLAHSYKLRSDVLRALAEMDCKDERSAKLRDVARTYDQMAKYANAIEHSYRHLNRLATDNSTQAV